MDRIECSVWNNGGTGWGLTPLGGPHVRRLHFRRDHNPIFVDLDGALSPVNIDKDGFWTNCPHLISVALRNWIMKNGLATADRVLLEVVKPYNMFKAVPMQAAATAKESA